MVPESIHFAGTQLAAGGCIIHIFYTPAERVRFTAFLTESLAARGGAVLACHRDGYQALCSGQGAVDFFGSGLLRIELCDDLMENMREIADSVKFSMRKRGLVRVLVDFGQVIPAESIFEHEAALAASLHGLDAVTLSQYDGTGLSAQTALEQCRSHAVAIIGNVFHAENARYVAPEKYLRQRAGH